MFTHGQHQDPGFLMLIIAIGATGVIFWRTVVKLAVMGLIFLIVLGISDLLQSLH